MLQLLLLALSASIRILSARQITIFCNNILAQLHVYRSLSIFVLKTFLTECTCSFPVPCEDEALVEFFGRALLSQLLPVEPDQQHPVTMLSIAVLTYRQAGTALCSQEYNSHSVLKNEVIQGYSFHCQIFSSFQGFESVTFWLQEASALVLQRIAKCTAKSLSSQCEVSHLSTAPRWPTLAP